MGVSTPNKPNFKMIAKVCLALVLFSFLLAYVSGEMRPFSLSEKKRATSLEEMKTLQTNSFSKMLKKKSRDSPAFDSSVPLFADPELSQKRDLSTLEQRDSEVLSMADDEIARRVFSARGAAKRLDRRLRNAMSRN